MILRKSAYFDNFRCIASACPDSCCKEWDVQVDGVSAEFYRNLTGALGDRLRSVLQDVDGEAVMTIEDGRCPMWRQDGLCRIQAELGEEALCHVCREFPRLTHDYGDFIERGLELSCPEAARMILSAAPAPFIEDQTDGGEAEYDEEAMEVLLRTRKQVLEILSDDSRSVGETLALALLYGYQAQGELDGDEELPFDSQTALESAAEFAQNADWELWLEFFRSLEILTPEWKEMLENPAPAPWSKEFPALARYFVERYWLQAVSDYDLACRVKFTVIACLTVKLLGGDIYRTAQLFSKEIENNTDNVEAILDAAYAHPAFTDDKLLGMLLGR
ncbi:MAG: flagellin lysine-N-methylase [Oscillospiraceae bacterium]|nr:flagellin lysine-N-methylase [Oscillospiraceae bacterium]